MVPADRVCVGKERRRGRKALTASKLLIDAAALAFWLWMELRTPERGEGN